VSVRGASIALVLASCAALPSTVTEAPLESVFGLPFVEVRIEGSRPLGFMIDTGFDISILDLDTATELSLTAEELTRTAQPGGEIEMGLLPPVSLAIGARVIDGVALTSVPLAGLAPVVGRRLDGILGHDVLERFVVILDPRAGRLSLAEPAGWNPPAHAHELRLRIEAGEPFATGMIELADGRRVPGEFKLDTGSLDVAGLNLNFVRDHALVEEDTREARGGGVGVGGSTEARLFRARAFELGPLRHEEPLIGYTVEAGGFENRADAGTIGVQVLGRARLILDYPRSRAFLCEPFDPPPPEDLTGMVLVEPEPGVLVVAIVMAPCPASAAGLRLGDRILALDGRAGLTLAEARALQRRAGPLRVAFEREGVAGEATIPCAPLLR